MSSITPITLKRYNLWGDKTPPFTRFASNPPFTQRTPSTLTGLSLGQLQEIEFTEDDENKLLQIDGDFVTVGNMIPNIIQGMWDVDGAGPLEFYKSSEFILQNELKMGETDTWEYQTQSLYLSRASLNLTECQYLTHIILTIAMESPNIELMCNLGNIPCWFKTAANILNNNETHKSEANTYVLTMPHNADFEWQDELTFKFRTSGRFLIQMQGMFVRSLLGACNIDTGGDDGGDTGEGVIGACCTYSLDGLPTIISGSGFEAETGV